MTWNAAEKYRASLFKNISLNILNLFEFDTKRVIYVRGNFLHSTTPTFLAMVLKNHAFFLQQSSIYIKIAEKSLD